MGSNINQDEGIERNKTMKYYLVSTWENVMKDGTWRRQFNFAIKENELSLVRINDTTKIEEISYKKYLFMVGFRWTGQFKEYLSFIENSTCGVDTGVRFAPR